MATMDSQPNESKVDGFAIVELVDRANSGDRSAAGEIRTLLAKYPTLTDLFEGNLAEVAADSLITAIAAERLGFAEAIRAQMGVMRFELAGKTPSPIERLIVERIVLCWLHVHHADCLCAEAAGKSYAHREYLQKQQDRAQKRYLTAIKSLATIRKLALPIRLDVQVQGMLETKAVESKSFPISRFAQRVSAN